MKWCAKCLAVGNCVQVNFLFFSRALNHFPYFKVSWTLLCWNPAWGLTSTIKLPSPGKSFDTNQLFLRNILEVNKNHHHLYHIYHNITYITLTPHIWHVLVQLQNTNITAPVHIYTCTYHGLIFQYFTQKPEIYFYAFFKRTRFFLTFPFVW